MKRSHKDRTDYTRGELAQLARRRMIQKAHGDLNVYKRKPKHKPRYDEEE